MKLAWSLAATVACGLVISLFAYLPAHSAAKDETANSKPSRTATGLLVLYDFDSTKGNLVIDRSGAGEPLNLRITNSKAVNNSGGALEVRGKTQIHSEEPASKITNAVRRSGEITIEAWISPADRKQQGPARIVTLSRNANERSFTLGQDGEHYDVRFRTTGTNTNGLPSVSAKKTSVKTAATHVVYTRERSGRTRLFVDGRPQAESTVKGATDKWNGSYRLALANEFESDRPWKGKYHLVAIYSRDLSPAEVKQNFEAGPEASGGRAANAELAAATKIPRDVQLFETKIAGLIANHCLECHDSVTKEGGLDLSRKEFALAGGDSGPSIIAGKSAESLLWEYVQSDAMPAERSPLSDEEKNALREWIDAGATWSIELIDPLAYMHDQRATANWIRRLTVPEYIETVRSAVGVDISKEAREILPPDLRADGFSNTAYNLHVDLEHVEAYSRLAEIIVDRMDVMKFVGRFTKSRSLSTDNTMRDDIAKVGKWLFRGPLQEREITNYSGIPTMVAAAGGDFEDAMKYTIEAMLQSPRFVYRVEQQTGDGTAWPVGQHELASRISYTIWGAPPDEVLLRAADEGELHDSEKLQEHVQRMLDDPRAIERSKLFIQEWLGLNRLANMRPNEDKFPQWNAQLARDMREETLAYFEDIAWKEQRPLIDLLNAEFTYATPALARHYGLKPQGKGFARYDLSDVPSRGGLLTQGSLLTIGGDEASMVTRGLFVMHELLRGVVKDPPPCVDTTPPPTKEGLTQRAISEQRIANANCAGCHIKFEPLAFGLEKFDGIGAYHEADKHGNKLRDDGEILIPNTAEAIPYKNSAELMDLLAKSERVRESLTWKVTQFAIGRPLVAADIPVLNKIHKEAHEGGGSYSSLITAIVMSDLVQKTRTEPQP